MLFLKKVRGIAESCPQHIAVEEGGLLTSYSELWKSVDNMAARLQRDGIRMGEVVPMIQPRSLAWIVQLLAHWKVGAVPLLVDPDTPIARRDQILELVGDDRLLDPEESPCYVIATSGTSGIPKLVLVSDDGLMPMLEAQVETFRLEKGSRALWIHNVAFDASISDVGSTVAAGATLVIRPELAASDLPALRKALVELRVTHFDVPPSVLPFLDPKEFPDLSCVILGGEVCDPESIRNWAGLEFQRHVVVVYGPTEATVCTSMAVADGNWSVPSIGNPLPGIHYQIDHGELLISGAGVALRYLGDPEQTAQRFSETDGHRTFRTRDRVDLDFEGRLVFQGRIDRQRKVHGQLVCPEEIEAVLIGHPNVRRAHVFVRESGERGQDQLCAIAETDAGVPELKEQLSSQLPDWMIPSRWVTVDRLASLPNGKINSAQAEAMVDFADKPQDGDTSILGIFREVLGNPNLKPTDDFFEHGGDSLAIMRALVVAEQAGFKLSADAISTGLCAAGVDELLNDPTKDGYGTSTTELRQQVDRQLASISTADHPTRDAAASQFQDGIFITGATGFLGSCLLGELAELTDAPIYCLVRDDSPDRILKATRAHGFSLSASRFDCLQGDLLRPRFGLTRDTWNELADGLSTVVHCAGDLRLFSDYASLAGANVDGTTSVLNLCSTGRKKHLHHASTLALFLDREPAIDLCHEQDELDGDATYFGGYSQTKWVAEQSAVRAGKTQGFPVAIHRLGLLTENSLTGHFAPGDWLTRFIRDMQGPGLGIVAEDAAFDFTAVDCAARDLALLVSAEATGTFHLTSGQQITASMLHHAVQKLEKQPETHHSLGAHGLAHNPRLGLAGSLGIFKSTGKTFSTDRLQTLLGLRAATYPEIDIEGLTVNLKRRIDG